MLTTSFSPQIVDALSWLAFKTHQSLQQRLFKFTLSFLLLHVCRYYHCKYIISYESCVTPVIWPVLGISYFCCSWWWAASLRSLGVSEKVIGETRGGLRCRRCHLCIKMRIIRGSADAGRTRPVIFNTHWSKISGKGRERTQRDGRGIRGTADFTRWI